MAVSGAEKSTVKITGHFVRTDEVCEGKVNDHDILIAKTFIPNHPILSSSFMIITNEFLFTAQVSSSPFKTQRGPSGNIFAGTQRKPMH